MSTKKLQILGSLGTAIYTQNDEPLDAADGSLWVDLDEDDTNSDDIAIDTALSESSTNPVQNQVITRSLYDVEAKLANLSFSGNSTDCVILTDQTTNINYRLYVSNGKLTLAASDVQIINNNISLTDKVTNLNYTLYVSDGKLTMEESEA